MLYSWQRLVMENMAQLLEHGSRHNGHREAREHVRDRGRVPG
jgi:hypothetical protein